LASGFGRVWRSPQASTPAKTTNIDMIAAETSIESIGMTELLLQEKEIHASPGTIDP
jgi:hypothetical protein